MSPIPDSFQEQEDTQDIPRECRHQVGHLLASMPSPSLVYHRPNVLITHSLELTVNFPMFAPGGPSSSRKAAVVCRGSCAPSHTCATCVVHARAGEGGILYPCLNLR